MKTRKRLMTLLLILAMVVTLMPAMTITSQANTNYNVNSMVELKAYMETNGSITAVLQKDISGHADADYEFWCTVKGIKNIDMNGHSISISNDNGRAYSTLFSIPSGANLTVYDSTKSGKGNIHFDGYINDAGSFRDRSIFKVDGVLTLTGVTVEAGRSKSFYSAKHATTVYKQIFGAAVTATKGSKVYVTASTLYGRGNYYTNTSEPSHGRNAGINAYSGSTVYFNDGQVRAKGGANCFNVSAGATVQVMNGSFTCDKLDAIKCEGSITSGIGRGRVGLTTDNVGNYAAVTSRSPSTGNLKDTTGMTIAPAGNGDGTFTAKSGDTVQENGVTVHRLLSSNPQASLDIFLKNYQGYYFREVNSFTPGLDYVRNYTMKLYRNGTLVKSRGPFSTSQRTFNVNEIFSGFTPAKNTTYNLVCEFDQVLNNKVHATGRSSDFYFKVVDEVALPVITSQSPADIYYDEGNTINLTVNATGTNLKYQWQYSDGPYWVAMSGSTSSLKLTSVPASWDGRIYRCAVSNSKGVAFTQNITLHLKSKKISRVDFQIDAPVHGVPLDFTAVTTTAGCKVTNVSWGIQMGSTVSPGYTPYTGQTLTVTIAVEPVSGLEFDNPVTGYIGSKKSNTVSNPSGNQKAFTFSFDTAAPASGDVAINTASLQINEPSVGSYPGYLEIVPDGPYKGTYSRDVRYNYGNTEWTCDGQKMSMSDTFKEGKTYKVQTTLTAAQGWKFTGGSRAELNGELMDAVMQGGNLVVSKTFVMDEGADEPIGKYNPFVDVQKSDDFYDAVIWAYYAVPQITNGTDATHFSPWNTVKRCEAVTFLWRSEGCPEPTIGYNPFVDVPSGSYYYKAVLWAWENNITKGTDDTHFSPEQTLSTQHIITFLYRTQNPGEDGWYGEAAAWAGNGYGGKPFGVNIGVDGTPCPRCYVVQFIYHSKAKG